MEFRRRCGPLGRLWLPGSGGGFLRSTSCDRAPSTFLNLGESPSVEGGVGVAGVQEGEFGIILFLVANAIWGRQLSCELVGKGVTFENDSISRDVPSGLLYDGCLTVSM